MRAASSASCCFNPPPPSSTGETLGQTDNPCARGFNPPPPSSTGETLRFKSRQEDIQVSIRPRLRARGKPAPHDHPTRLPSRFNPPPPSSTGETSLAWGGPRSRSAVSIRPRLRARGKHDPCRDRRRPKGSFNPPPPSSTGETPNLIRTIAALTLFQSAPAFEHGGNPALPTQNNRCRMWVSIRPRLRARGKPGRRGAAAPRVSIRPRLRARGKPGLRSPRQFGNTSFNPPPPSSTGETWMLVAFIEKEAKFQSAPAFEHGGNSRCSAWGSARIRFQSAPAFEHGGNLRAIDPAQERLLRVSIRPRLRARGKLRGARAGPTAGWFQSAPAFEHGGDTFCRGGTGNTTCFNPPPPSSTGETPSQHRDLRSLACQFQSAPAFEHGGNPRIWTYHWFLSRFNPPPPSSTGETPTQGTVLGLLLHARFNPPPPSSTGETPP